eukprot:4021017-Prymnesium_polylepis.1
MSVSRANLSDAFALFAGADGHIDTDKFMAILTNPAGGKPFTKAEVEAAIRLRRYAAAQGNVSKVCSSSAMARDPTLRSDWKPLPAVCRVDHPGFGRRWELLVEAAERHVARRCGSSEEPCGGH